MVVGGGVDGNVMVGAAPNAPTTVGMPAAGVDEDVGADDDPASVDPDEELLLQPAVTRTAEIARTAAARRMRRPHMVGKVLPGYGPRGGLPTTAARLRSTLTGS
jgi:hypothetical protein